jgi:hypothetical protein
MSQDGCMSTNGSGTSASISLSNILGTKEEGEEVTKESEKAIEFRFDRTSRPLGKVFDAWLNPKIPGYRWNAAEKFSLDPKV